MTNRGPTFDFALIKERTGDFDPASAVARDEAAAAALGRELELDLDQDPTMERKF